MTYYKSVSDFFKPDPVYNLVEWSDEHRMLSSESSSEPGRWRTSRTPYLRAIMLALSNDSPINEVVVEKGAQVGFTEMGNNWIGYIISHCPGPTLCVQPNLENAKKFSRQRLAPLIRDTPEVKAKISDKKGRDSDNSTLSKSFLGGILMIAGAQSAVGLRSMPIKNLFLDEVDGYPMDVEGEGDPVALAEARQRTFSKRKRLKGSTPTEMDTSRIHPEYMDSNQQKFYLPCPECKHMQPLKFGQLRWPKDEPQNARYHCVECDFAISNWQKTKMLDTGVWVAENPDHPNKKKAGFHISSLYSPVGWFSWEEIAADYDKALADSSGMKMKAFTNTVLGLPWEEECEVPDWHRLFERRENYQIGTVPEGVCFLTAGIDIQRDRIEMEVVGWGVGKESWSIDYIIMDGDTSKLVGENGERSVWQKLEETLATQYPVVGTPRIKKGILMAAVDSGYNANIVYNWVRTQSMKVIPVKGRDAQQTIITSPSYVDVKSSGKVIKRGVRLWVVGVSVLKSELYGWLNLNKSVDNSPQPGYCHFPEYDSAYFKQLTAEKLKTVIDKKGFPKKEWHKFRDRNEALDIRGYSRVAASVLGIDRFKAHHYQAFAEKVSSGNSPAKSRPKESTRRKSSWL